VYERYLVVGITEKNPSHSSFRLANERGTSKLWYASLLRTTHPTTRCRCARYSRSVAPRAIIPMQSLVRGAPSNGDTQTRGSPNRSSRCASSPHRRMNAVYSPHDIDFLRSIRSAHGSKRSVSSLTRTLLVRSMNFFVSTRPEKNSRPIKARRRQEKAAQRIAAARYTADRRVRAYVPFKILVFFRVFFQGPQKPEPFFHFRLR
jgi:hypothetical protein